MTEEVQQNLAEVESAQAPEVTATTENAQNAPEVADQSGETAEEKRFTQAELDAMIGKRLAREQRKWEREQQAKQAEMQARQSMPKELPPVDQFECPEGYIQALTIMNAFEVLDAR